MQVRFSDCVLDLDRRELTRGASPIPVGPQVFDLLVYLVQNRERVVSKDDLFEAIWQGRIVSDSTLTSHINAVRKAVGDSGEAQALIRTVPRKGFRFVGDVGTADEMAATAKPGSLPPALSLPDKPSVAVLPFQNLSGDPEQDYFADGVVEDIITGLSRIKWLFVIARNSSFTYKGRAIDVKTVGRELGVRYVLEGSIRKAGNRIRLSGQLVDATTSASVWADRYEGALGDIFDLQDLITGSVIGAIEPNLRQAEIERARRKRSESLDAYDLYLRAFPHAYANNPEDGRAAIALLDEALRLDPSYASAHGLAAWCHQQLYRSGSRQENKAAALRHSRAAVTYGGDDATALSMAGFVLSAVGHEHEAAINATERSLALNASARSFAFSAIVRGFSGHYETAIEHASRSIRLNPLDPMGAQPYIALAFSYVALGRFDEGAAAAAKAIQLNPRFSIIRAINVIALVGLGRTEAAWTAAHQLLEIMPEFRLQMLTGLITQEKVIADWSVALRGAGIPG